MRFARAAILAPKIRTLKSGEQMNLHYRIAVRPRPWTPETLRAMEDAAIDHPTLTLR
jgi:hypothetical protein